MKHVSSPSMDINAYRELCQRQVARCDNLTNGHKVVLMILALYVNRHSWIAWPDFDTLAADAGVDRSTAIRAINEAKRLGLIKRVRRGGRGAGGRGISNRYTFVLQHTQKEVAATHQNSGTHATLTYDEHMNSKEDDSASIVPLTGLVTLSEDSTSSKKGSGERGTEYPKSEADRRREYHRAKEAFQLGDGPRPAPLKVPA